MLKGDRRTQQRIEERWKMKDEMYWRDAKGKIE
jgi:hypothetical protein